jgi:quercetin dioxygenase-like cupin family protein
MPLVCHGAVPEREMRPGIRGKFLANKELGATGVSLLVNTADAGAAVPVHRHTVEEAVMMFEGRIWVRVADEEHLIGPGETVIIPPNTVHAWGNAGPTTARMLWVWGGADPFGDATYLQGEPPAVNV